MEYEYNTYKIINKDEEELLKEKNPFALVVLARKYALETKDDETKKLKFKLKLIRLLLSRGYSKEKIRDLFIFIDTTIKLNDVLKQRLFYEELEKQKEGKVMEVIGDFEEAVRREGRREGRKEGLEEGVEKGIKNSIIKLLKKDFSREEIIDLLEIDEKMVEEAEKEIRDE